MLLKSPTDLFLIVNAINSLWQLWNFEEFLEKREKRRKNRIHSLFLKIIFNGLIFHNCQALFIYLSISLYLWEKEIELPL